MLRFSTRAIFRAHFFCGSFASLCLMALALVLIPANASSQISPPRPGVELPPEYYEEISRNQRAFQFERAWIDKARRARDARHDFLSRRGPEPLSLASLPPGLRQEITVSGTMQVPVILIKFSNTGADPYPISTLQAKLFDGPNPTGTMAEFYEEMSYGALTLEGTVYGWVQGAGSDGYYEGGANGLSCINSKTGQLILEALQATDPAVDFGLYDNDGPDGVPNSGDDDGYVDFIAIVHPETGGECGTTNIWSHRWVVGGWPEFGNNCRGRFGSPWFTNDVSANGGAIRIWDYTIQPAKGSVSGCGPGPIEIGVFAHEFGHAFGLPDLYDTNGGGQGIGVHGLMGSGSWNRPFNPAHMSAWSKLELGWVLPTMVGPVDHAYSIENINVNQRVYQLNIMEEKFARSDLHPIAGSYSLHCGLGAGAAGARNWNGGAGYGNSWRESARREFTYDGTGAVALTYDVRYDLEYFYDYGRIKIEAGGAVNTVAEYTGIGQFTGVTIDLSPYLSGAGTYEIVAEMTTDFFWSDEDGLYNSGMIGPFKLDNISVVGGGEDYFTDFENYEDGWHTDPGKNPTREFFLVENRSRAGQFDQHLRAEGLLIWHIEQNVAHSGYGNTGGTNTTVNLKPAGVVLEEADGLRQLLLGQGNGDSGDIFPGSSARRQFDNATVPNSMSYNGSPTNVAVSGISNAGATMTATMRAGRFAPAITAVGRSRGFRNAMTPITDVAGGGFVHGATFLLRDGTTEHPASGVEWVGKAKLAGEIDLTGVTPGDYDLVVRNPDGQEAVLSGGFTVSDAPVLDIRPGSCKNPFNRRLFDAVRGTNPNKGGTLPVAILGSDDFDVTQIDLSTLRLEGVEFLPKGSGPHLQNVAGTPERDGDCSCPSGPTDDFVDLKMQFRAQEIAGAIYRDAGNDGAVLTLTGMLLDGTPFVATDCVEFVGSASGEVTVSGDTPFLDTAVPNPFNPVTRVSFSLPRQSQVELAVYDVRGRLVERLVGGVKPAGRHVVEWDAVGRPSGIYFYRLTVGNFTETRKLVLLK